jgi:hypothetical protein
MKYKLQVTDYDGNTVVFTFQEESLAELLETFKRFLKAAGFSFDGELVIEEEQNDT